MTTTLRLRRTKPQQAADILKALLKAQEAKAQRLYDAYGVAEAEAVRTRRAIELLDQPALPGMEMPEEPLVAPDLSRSRGTSTAVSALWLSAPLVVPDLAVESSAHPMEPPTDLKSVAVSLPEELPRIVYVPRHMEPTGDDLEHSALDVWPNSGRSSSGNLSQLMDSRKAKCNLCLGGIPFATAKRTEHYVVTRDDQGVERGFEYSPCKGIRTT